MKQVGRYQIVEELGRGAMGIVYKALDPAIGRTVAIKTIRLTDFTDTDERQRIRERLLREAQSAGVLSHPNIITIYDVLEEGEYAYIFMEYVNGLSLEKMLRKRSLPEKRALLHYLRQVSAALDYAHRKGIIHRDIKPANIIISEGRTEVERLAKIADFGVAKFISQEMTQGGTMIGTPNYMSPEQIQGTTVDGRSDEFSLAVVVYEILSGVKPFAAENLPALFYLICKQDPQPAEQVNPKLGESVGKVLQHALAKNPDERFASCGDFMGALSSALTESHEWIAVPGQDRARERSMLEETVVEKSRPLGPGPRPAILQTPRSGHDYGSEAGISSPARYELPVIQRRRRDDRSQELEEAPQRGSFGKRFGLVLAICLAIAGAAVFLRQWKSALKIPIQVLETKSAPMAPPPTDTNPPKKEEQPAKQNPGNAEPAQSEPAGQKPEHTDTGQNAPANQKPESTETEQNAPAKQNSGNTGPGQTEQANQGERSSDKASPGSAAPDRHAAADESAAPGLADVELLSDPPGAKMVVDNRFRDACTSPCTISLPNGRHTMVVQLNGYNEAHRIFTVPADDSIFVTLSKNMGVLVVTSSPPGASIFVDGKNFGHTPSTLHLPTGTHTLLLVNGALRHEETVDIQNDAFASTSFRFSKQ